VIRRDASGLIATSSPSSSPMPHLRTHTSCSTCQALEGAVKATEPDSVTNVVTECRSPVTSRIHYSIVNHVPDDRASPLS